VSDSANDIVAPMIGKKRTEKEATNAEDRNSNGEARLCGFRPVYVFDRLSCDLWLSFCAPDVIRECHFKKSPR
jgi:hypothetical protein